MIRKLIVPSLLVVLLVAAPAVCWAQGDTGKLEIIGAPPELSTGRYDRQAGIFSADVTGIEGALVQVTFEEVKIVGQKMEWRTDDDYLIFTTGATLTKEDFTLTAETIEYYGDANKLKGQGSVVVVTEDATVYSDTFDYDEETDQAVFIGNVRVVFEDGDLTGEKFVMFLETSELQFFGAFQGLFNTED